MNRPPRATRRSGYTLMELTVSLPIMGLLVVGMASAINVATRAVPDGSSISSATLTSTRALDLLAGELSFATSIATNVSTSTAARQITFTVADRDGATPAIETVTYAWSGVSGDPLLRTFNGTTTTLVADVREFQLAYDKRANTVTTTTDNTSAESLLVSADGSTSSVDYSITSSNWYGQFFLPVLSSNVTGWTVTRVRVRARDDGSRTGTTRVQICAAQNRQPTNTVLAEQSLSESDLTTSYVLQTFTFNTVPLQAPTDGLCLVLRPQANSPTCRLRVWSGGQLYAHGVRTSNGGSSWTSETDDSLAYQVYGTVTTQSTSTSTTYGLTNVRCTLRVGGSPRSRLTTSIRTFNEPQVTGP